MTDNLTMTQDFDCACSRLLSGLHCECLWGPVSNFKNPFTLDRRFLQAWSWFNLFVACRGSCMPPEFLRTPLSQDFADVPCSWLDVPLGNRVCFCYASETKWMLCSMRPHFILASWRLPSEQLTLPRFGITYYILAWHIIVAPPPSRCVVLFI